LFEQNAGVIFRPPFFLEKRYLSQVKTTMLRAKKSDLKEENQRRYGPNPPYSHHD
jgi:hypothetical protein